MFYLLQIEMGDEEKIRTSNIFWTCSDGAQINLRMLYFIVEIVRCLSVIHIEDRLSIIVSRFILRPTFHIDRVLFSYVNCYLEIYACDDLMMTLY